jgi:hypothetical protein
MKDSGKKEGMSFRQLNFLITLVGSLLGFAIPQNNIFSGHSNDPIPDDIRGNKKEGEEYSTIGDVLKKNGTGKVMLIIAIILLAIMICAMLYYGVMTNGEKWHFK